jgi:hypothetical protein
VFSAASTHDYLLAHFVKHKYAIANEKVDFLVERASAITLCNAFLAYLLLLFLIKVPDFHHQPNRDVNIYPNQATFQKCFCDLGFN